MMHSDEKYFGPSWQSQVRFFASPGVARFIRACVLAKIWKRKRSEAAADIFLKMLRSPELFAGLLCYAFWADLPSQVNRPRPRCYDFRRVTPNEQKYVKEGEHRWLGLTHSNWGSL